MGWSWVVLIRGLRPLVLRLALVVLPLYRLSRVLLSSAPGCWHDDVTVLDLVVSGVAWGKAWVLRVVADPLSEDFLRDGIVTMVFLCFQLLCDFCGVLVLLGLARTSYISYHHRGWSWWSELKHRTEDLMLAWARHHVPAVSRYLQAETDKMIPGFVKAYGTDTLPEPKQLTLPVQGRCSSEVLRELSFHAEQEHDASWKKGRTSGTVYVTPDDHGHLDLMHQVYGLYSIANALHAGVWPKLTQCEAEVVAMTSEMLHNTSGVGCTTSGGTESLLLAIKAHWVFYGKRRGIRHPELVCGSTVHAAVDKACELFGIRKVVVDCSGGGGSAGPYRLCPKQAGRRVTSNTIMIVASAPSYPQGTIDPIEALADLALRYDIGLHVDACLGGFVLPFAAPGTVPPFDMEVPGVTSMSVDTHKYGYAPKGTSVVLYRTPALRHAQYFSYARWTGGLYATPTLAGSRPSALVACAWAALVSVGEDGYRERGRSILVASRTIVEGIRTTIPALYVLGDDDNDDRQQRQPTMVVCFGSDVVNVYRVADAMQVRGWQLNSLQRPASVHVCVTLAVAPRAREFVEDLKRAVEDVKQEGPNSDRGTAGLYGMSGSIPDGPVNDILKAYLDVALQP